MGITMSGVMFTVNSKKTLSNAHLWLDEEFEKLKYMTIKLVGGKRTLSQNALKSVWYSEISKHRGDVTAKDVENQCKYEFGTVILRRHEANNWLYERTIDLLTYEQKVRCMTRFAITSIMSVKELKEYLLMIQQAYPFLTNEK